MPTRKPKITTTAEDILRPHPPEIQELAERLRDLIKSTIPDATESANPTWRSLSYHHDSVGYFCGIFPLDGRVSLAFEWGVLLPDPQGMLVSGGKQLKYLHLRSTKDIKTHAIKKLLQAALELPRERSAKLALIQANAKRVDK